VRVNQVVDRIADRTATSHAVRNGVAVILSLVVHLRGQNAENRQRERQGGRLLALPNMCSTQFSRIVSA
jgi:hypothetical protein